MASITEARLIDGKPYMLQADGSLVPAKGGTDWPQLNAMPDSAIADDPDAMPFSDADWQSAVRLPSKKYIHLGIDDDVLDWFKQAGRGYQTRMNAVLRMYVEKSREAAGHPFKSLQGFDEPGAPR